MTDFDGALASPEFFADPYPVYRRMREDAPVYWSPAWNAWVLTRHSDVVALQRDPRIFSSRGRVAAQLDRLPEPARSEVDLLRRHYAVGLTHSARPGQPDPDIFLATQAGLSDFRAYLADLIADHQRHPRHDVLSLLMAAREQSDKLTDDELVSTCVTLFVAGHETTTHAMRNGLIALLRHPDQLALLRAEPGRLPAAFEELMRYDTSVQRSARRVAADGDIGGQPVRAGEIVLGMIGAANHDPAIYPHPDALDVKRKDVKHSGFGFGIHFCLGAPLARMEIPIALGQLLARDPRLDFDPSQPLRWRRDVALRGVDAFWVRDA